MTEDIVKGKGKAAKAGRHVSMQYVGNSWSTGEQFDASWDRGASRSSSRSAPARSSRAGTRASRG